MSAMITVHPHALQRTLLLAGLVACGLSLAFLAGRASTRVAYARAPQAAPARAAPATETPRQPWAERGFRDGESWKELGTSPDTNEAAAGGPARRR